MTTRLWVRGLGVVILDPRSLAGGAMTLHCRPGRDGEFRSSALVRWEALSRGWGSQVYE